MRIPRSRSLLLALVAAIGLVLAGMRLVRERGAGAPLEAAASIAAPDAQEAAASELSREVAAAPEPRVRKAVGPTARAANKAPEPERVVVARVQVLDVYGQSVAGVPVGWYLFSDCDGARGVVATEGPQSVALIELGAKQRAAFVEAGDPIWIAIEAPLAGREKVELDLARQSDEPIQLQLGEHGSVRVALEPGRLEGRAFTALVEFAPPANQWPYRSEDELTTRVAFEGSELHLPWVSPGHRLWITVVAEGAGEVGTLALDGPTRPGEEVRAELVLDPGPAAISGRLLGPDGVVLASVDFHAMMTEAGSYTAHLVGTSDEQGRFVVEGLELPRDEPRLVMSVSKGELQVVADLSARTHEDPIELGELVLGAPPMVVSGRVLGPEGEPIEQAWVELERLDPDGSGRGLTISGRNSDESGRFVIEGIAPDVPLALRVDATGWLASAPVPFEGGATDVVIVLQPAGTLQGWVMHDEGLPQHLFEIQLVELDPPAPASALPHWDRARRRDNEDGFTFIFSEVPPGRASFRLGLDGDPEALLVVRDVLIPSGATGYDERLQGIDLSSLLHHHELGVLDARGARVPDGRVEARPAGASGPVTLVDLDDGVAELLSRHAVIDLVVSSPGMRHAEVPAVRGAAQVTLELGLELVLELAADVVVAEEDCLELVLIPAGMTDEEADERWYELPVVEFGPRCTARVLVSEPGVFRPCWYFYSEEGALADRAGTIRVVESSEPQRFEVGPDGPR